MRASRSPAAPATCELSRSRLAVAQSTAPAEQAIAASAASTTGCTTSGWPPARSKTRSRSACARQFEFGLEGGSERALERTAIRVEVGHDHARECRRAQAPGVRGATRSSPVARTPDPSARWRKHAPASEDGSSRSIVRPAADSAANSVSSAGVSRRKPASSIGGPIAGSASASTRRRARSPASQPCASAQLALDRSCPAEEGLLVARQGPARHGREVRAMRPEPQPARSRAGRRGRPGPGAREHREPRGAAISSARRPAAGSRAGPGDLRMPEATAAQAMCRAAGPARRARPCARLPPARDRAGAAGSAPGAGPASAGGRRPRGGQYNARSDSLGRSPGSGGSIGRRQAHRTIPGRNQPAAAGGSPPGHSPAR